MSISSRGLTTHTHAHKVQDTEVQLGLIDKQLCSSQLTGWRRETTTSDHWLLQDWQKNFCVAAGYDFISSFDYFWRNQILYNGDEKHPTTNETKQLTDNFIWFIAFSSFWDSPWQYLIQTNVSPIVTSSTDSEGLATDTVHLILLHARTQVLTNNLSTDFDKQSLK